MPGDLNSKCYHSRGNCEARPAWRRAEMGAHPESAECRSSVPGRACVSSLCMGPQNLCDAAQIERFLKKAVAASDLDKMKIQKAAFTAAAGHTHVVFDCSP